MDLAFNDKTIREACEKEAVAQKRYGINVAKSLKNRLTDLYVADWIEEIPATPVFFLDGTESKCKISLQDGFYIILSCAHVKPPILEDGSINWKKVRKIKILSISK